MPFLFVWLCDFLLYQQTDGYPVGRISLRHPATSWWRWFFPLVPTLQRGNTYGMLQHPACFAAIVKPQSGCWSTSTMRPRWSVGTRYRGGAVNPVMKRYGVLCLFCHRHVSVVSFYYPCFYPYPDLLVHYSLQIHCLCRFLPDLLRLSVCSPFA